ncbi:MAG: GNAT family N-acetyltransferase [Chryseolinea sp.]
MELRTMEPTDIPSGLSLCRSAGWNQLARDWELFLRIEPQGSRVCLDEGGNVVGTVTTIRYHDRFAWIGMVLVAPNHRRKGIGFKLLEEAIQVLNDQSCVKLDATPAGREVYIKLGFEDEYMLTRMSASAINAKYLRSSPAATPLTSADFEKVASFDRETFGADRTALLTWMSEGAPEFAIKVVEGDQLKGYCFGRPGYRYAHIGPVVASNTNVAKELLSTALKYVGGMPVILDVPHHHKAWKDWLEAVGFSELRSFMRMYRGNNSYPGIPENQYAILGPEFG